jgi:hypothetical protein
MAESFAPRKDDACARRVDGVRVLTGDFAATFDHAAI